MAFEIHYTKSASDHVRGYAKFEQKIILDAVDEQLEHDAAKETRNRKRLGENEISNWELRVQRFRVFYDIEREEDREYVKINAVGHKEHNVLYIGGKKVDL